MSKVLLGSLLTLPLTSLADPWHSFPGTKATGLSHAFTAIADDPSAAWHNPAGLYQINKRSLTLETHTPSTVNSQSSKVFLSLNQGDGQSYGMAAYYYQPYQLEYHLDDTHLTGVLKEKISIAGLGYSGNLFNSQTRPWLSNFYYGLTLEYLNNNISTSQLQRLDDLDNPFIIDDSRITKPTGWSGSIGILTTLYQGQIRNPLSPTIKLGAVYRRHSNQDHQTVTFPGSFNDSQSVQMLNNRNWFNSKPTSYSIGVSSTMQLTSSPAYGLITSQLAIQQDTTHFDSLFSSSHYRRHSIGAAIRLTLLPTAFIHQLELRLGGYRDPSDSTINALPTTTGVSWGAQLVFYNQLALEFASERHYWTATLRYDW